MDYLKDDPMPADKMAIKPIEQLIDDNFLAYLGQQEDSKLKAMRVYFGQMADLRKSLFTLGISLEDRISLLQGVVEFCQVMRKEFPKNAISPNLLLQLETSLHALTELAHICPTLLLSAISTLVVENFFSTMRQSQRYPTLFQYGSGYQRAVYEFIKRHLQDSTITYPSSHIGKYYNISSGLQFQLADIKFSSKGERREQRRKKQRTEEEEESDSGNSSDDDQVFEDMIRLHPPQRKTLTMREVTSKMDPRKKFEFAME